MRAHVLLAAAILAGTAFAASANANPVFVGYSLDGGATVTQIGTGSGTAGVIGYDLGNYTISMTATGSPVLPEPNFGSNTLTVKARRAGTIILYTSETGLSANVFSFTSGLSNNPSSDTSVKESVYYSASNNKFATDTLLASATLAPGITQQIVSPAGVLASKYSITETYTISFGADGGTVDATILEKGSVPEPMSLSILGAGLAGMGLVRMRRKA